MGIIEATEDSTNLTKERFKQNLLWEKNLIRFPKQDEVPNNIDSSNLKNGEEELKVKIIYRPWDNRYMARQQILGHKIIVYGKTEARCKAAFNEKYRELIKQNGKKQGPLTFKQFYERWYKENKEPYISKDTQKDIKRILNKYLPLDNKKLTELDKPTILNFLSSCENNRVKEKIIIYLKAILKCAFQEGLIKSYPFANIVTGARIVKVKKPFSYEEQKLIKENLKGKELEPLILFYLATGIRKNEFDNKKIENQIYADEQIYRPINLKGRNNIERYKEIMLSKQCLNLYLNNKEIFKKYDAETIYRQFKDFLSSIGIKGKSIVNLRHTFATNHFYLGTPDLYISKWMGHSKINITKDVYMSVEYRLNAEKIKGLYSDLFYQI